MHFTNEVPEAQRGSERPSNPPEAIQSEVESEFGLGPADFRAFHSPVLFSLHRERDLEQSIVHIPSP